MNTTRRGRAVRMRLTDAALTEVTPDAAAGWRVLADAASEPNAFADPRFLLPSAAAHPHAREGRVMLVDDGEATVGALSYARRERKVGRLTLRTVSTSESFSAFEGERFHPLTAPGRAEEVFISLIEGHGLSAPTFWRSVAPLNGDLPGALMRAARRMDAPVLPEGEQEFACAAPRPSTGPPPRTESCWLSPTSRPHLGRTFGGSPASWSGTRVGSRWSRRARTRRPSPGSCASRTPGGRATRPRTARASNAPGSMRGSATSPTASEQTGASRCSASAPQPDGLHHCGAAQRLAGLRVPRCLRSGARRLQPRSSR